MKFLSYLLISCFFVFTATSLNLHFPHFHSHKRGKVTQVGADLVIAGLACATTAATWETLDFNTRALAISTSIATCAKLGVSVCDVIKALDKKVAKLEKEKQEKAATELMQANIKLLEDGLKSLACTVEGQADEIRKLNDQIKALGA
ncbi:hypothetical protein K502DRAFT_325831 [Neoconidiobolus thromboides FSU 785]|nr:hypothetical protein K502DRAFT_325831 [Neoconidiobolus thromboides FSU 785]